MLSPIPTLDAAVDANRYELANIDICRRAAKVFAEKPDAVIKFECFNQEEAEWFERYMKWRYPEVRFFTTWLVFGRENS